MSNAKKDEEKKFFFFYKAMRYFKSAEKILVLRKCKPEPTETSVTLGRWPMMWGRKVAFSEKWSFSILTILKTILCVAELSILCVNTFST